MESPQRDCVICASRDYRVKYDFASAAIWRCDRCGMMMLWPQPSEQGLQAVYRDDYFRNEQFLSRSNDTLYGYVDYLHEKRTRRLDMDTIFTRIAAGLGPRPDGRSALLEIGCGLGLFLDEAHDRGFDVEGVEFNRFAYEHIRGKYTFPVHFGSVNDVRFDRPSYDVCCMLDVIEHLVAPGQAMGRVADLVRPGGLCVLQTMDSASFVSRLLGKRLEDFRRVREHLYFFDRSTIADLLGRHGFDVLSISSIGHSFELGMLYDRLDLAAPGMFRWLKKLVRPRWLLKTTMYLNPGTKMLVIARRTGR